MLEQRIIHCLTEIDLGGSGIDVETMVQKVKGRRILLLLLQPLGFEEEVIEATALVSGESYGVLVFLHKRRKHHRKQ